jgi:hypothetical protein
MREPPRAGRVHVLVGEDGSIVAAILREGSLGAVPGGHGIASGAAPQVDFVPEDGQSVHDLDVPDDLLTEEGVDLNALLSFHLERGSDDRLVR